MMRLLREFRLVPVVVVAISGLLTLKLLGLLFDGGYILLGAQDNPAPAVAVARASKPPLPVNIRPAPIAAPGALADKRSTPTPAALVALGFNDAAGDITGSAASTKKEEPKPEAKKPAEPKPEPAGTRINLNNDQPVSPAERAILERLQERRKELEARAREIEIRENLLKSAEKKLEQRAGEIKEAEGETGGTAQRKEAEAAKVKSLVTMYENMKAKDAARIFDRLDLKILVEVASQINPRRMSDILGLMSSEAAERLTVEMATRANLGDKSQNASDLPKIQGRPNGG